MNWYCVINLSHFVLALGICDTFQLTPTEWYLGLLVSDGCNFEFRGKMAAMLSFKGIYCSVRTSLSTTFPKNSYQ